MIYRRIHRILNVIIGFCVFGFLVIFIKAPSPNQKHIDDGVPVFSSNEWDQLKDEIGSTNNDSSLSGWNFKPKDGKNSITGADIVEAVNFLNENFDVLNTNKFGGLENVERILVIQVHNRPRYLQFLIDSMRNTRGIEKTLLVFSHDINTAPINEMIRNITFARVYQIFYPFNIQLFPDVFPGTNSKDCAEKIGRDAAKSSGCQNWESPDKYGNYRVAQVTQIKHHWWWKMNFVFDGIVEKFKMADPWVLLLEEDHMLAPDALHVLDIIVNKKPTYCATCEIISLGVYLKSTSKYGKDIKNLGVHPWYGSKHNMGMALQKNTWEKVKGCATMFCHWDDYNWDWSLMQVTAKCLPQRFRVIFAKSPRVFHIGDCGFHTHRCDVTKALDSTVQLFKDNKNELFPQNLTVTDVSRRSLKPSKENGGWGDKRDQSLCMLNTTPLLPLKSSNYSDVLLSMLTSKVQLTNEKHDGL